MSQLVKWLEKNQRLLFLIIIVIAFSIIITIEDKKEHESISQVLFYSDYSPLKFNYPSGTYNQSIKIALKKDIQVPNDIEIYYTLDGNDPNEQSNKFTQEIDLMVGENELKVYPLKVRFLYKEKWSDIYTETYILDNSSGITLPIISMTTDNDNLYNEETGIFIDDNLYKRTDEWIRPAHIMMSENNNIIWNQDIGIQISGKASAMLNNKSFKIIASETYDEKNPRFILNNLNNNREIYPNSNVTEYNTLRLRTGSHDIYQGNIRNSLLSRLAMESNFPGYSNVSRAILFLNGEFYAITDIQENFSDTFLKRHYDLDDTDNIQKQKGGENEVLNNLELTNLFLKDLNNETNREKLEKKVDMNDFLHYYALHLLMNDTDWPKNNYEIWRYKDAVNNNNPYEDGRYRFVIYDADLSYYREDNEIWGEAGSYLWNYLTKTDNFVLSNVLKSDYYKKKFAVIMSDLLNTSFKTDNILNLVDEEYSRIQKDLIYFYDQEITDDLNNKIQDLKKTIKEQNERIKKSLDKDLHFNKYYNLNIKTNEEATLSWNYMTLFPNSNYENSYPEESEITIIASPVKGYLVKGFLINDKIVEGNTITINKEYISSGSVNLEVITEKDPETELIISEISAKSDSDWMKFTNVSENTINLKKYYISDNLEKITKYNLPDINLESGKSIIINGKKNYFAIGDYICNFNLNNTEELYLYNIDKNEIVDKIAIPRMNSLETYGRYLNSNIYMFYDNSDNQRKK